MITIKEKFVPVQINQNLCMRCERCLRACKANAIYFDHGIRLVDYTKCRACLNCVQVCPKNAIEVTSIQIPEQVLSIKIEHNKCNLCLKCVEDNGRFCPKNLFYIDTVKVNGNDTKGIRFKFKEIAKCQGCLNCESSCPEQAIKPVKYEGN